VYVLWYAFVAVVVGVAAVPKLFFIFSSLFWNNIDFPRRRKKAENCDYGSEDTPKHPTFLSCDRFIPSSSSSSSSSSSIVGIDFDLGAAIVSLSAVLCDPHFDVR
jgi:hypothetical protein